MEVTVISTTQITVLGVLVMIKLLSVTEELLASVKKGVVEPSGRASTSIRTPPEGILEVMVIFKGKVGPGAGGSTLLLVVTGEVTTVRFSSGVRLLEGDFWHPKPASKKSRRAMKWICLVVFIFLD